MLDSLGPTNPPKWKPHCHVAIGTMRKMFRTEHSLVFGDDTPKPRCFQSDACIHIAGSGYPIQTMVDCGVFVLRYMMLFAQGHSWHSISCKFDPAEMMLEWRLRILGDILRQTVHLTLGKSLNTPLSPESESLKYVIAPNYLQIKRMRIIQSNEQIKARQ